MAPTHVMPIIRPAGNGRKLMMAGWGPFALLAEARSARQAALSTINARAETIRTAPTYREPFKTKRCLVPATGWYEWQKLDAKKNMNAHVFAARFLISEYLQWIESKIPVPLDELAESQSSVPTYYWTE